jgi:tRNA(fMet)-specific endonuclease VapC
MLEYMLDTDICIYAMKNHPAELRRRFNRLAEQLCISSITLAELYYRAVLWSGEISASSGKYCSNR